jgi:hypothetical protein
MFNQRFDCVPGAERGPFNIRTGVRRQFDDVRVAAEMINADMNYLDKVPFWALVAFLGVPGPMLFATLFGGTTRQIVLTPIVGALIGLAVAYSFLREKKLRLNASWGEMRLAMRSATPQPVSPAGTAQAATSETKGLDHDPPSKT